MRKTIFLCGIIFVLMLVAAPVQAITTDPVFTAGKPNLLFEGSYVDEPPGTSGHPRYDITPDGQQFVMIRPEERMDQLLVVVNWLDELKRLVPVDN